MVCPHCGASTGVAGGCASCGTSPQTAVVTGVVPIDTTGLPAGATFAPTIDGTRLASAASGNETIFDTHDPREAAPARQSAGALQVGQSFGPRYHIIKLLGAGGMGAVYQAWDAELSVAVALKVIRTDQWRGTASPEAEKRFKNELLLARQVTHKHVVRIHDLGEIEGIKYITMPYIQGEDLASRLRRDGKLPIEMALRIARQIAAGLEAAHDAGVVHRDLKPANVMISATDGDVQAQILDFGVSASASEAGSGAAIGTLEYMAPEQSTGAAVDQRADIYAFGLIVYEMLTGLRRFGATTPQARIEAMRLRCRDGVPPLHMADPEIPEGLASLVTRCLEIDPAARFATSRELSAALAELDDTGQPIPKAWYLTRRLLFGAAALVAAMLGGTFFVAQRAAQPAVVPDPISIVIADVENLTGDPTFDRTLEPMLRRALEGAGFITAYDRNGIARTLGIPPPEVLDGSAAQQLAANQGIGVVLAGSIAPQGNAYALTLRAVQTFTGTEIARVNQRAARKDQVLEVATNMIGSVRRALGDATADGDPIFRQTSLSATSLEVVKAYAAAQDAASNNRFEEALAHARAAVQLDPTFGIGHQVMAVTSGNLRRIDDAVKYSKVALSYLDGMTERERYSTRGYFYRITGDYQQCVKEYGELISRYAADIVGLNQLALCSTQLRDMARAVAEMRRVVALVPERSLFRTNLSYYSSYAGQFADAEAHARAIDNPDVYARLALALAQTGQGRFDEAAETYRQMASENRVGASLASSGLGDLAAVQGRFAEAIDILRQGAAADLEAGNGDAAATKYAAIAHVELARGRPQPAVAAADTALAHSQAVKIRLLAGRAFIQAGEPARAEPLATALGNELLAEPQAYARLLEGEAALARGDSRQAVTRFTESLALLDTWIGHFDLGRAYLQAGAFAQADSEFDRCLKRAGEALALFLDEEPTYAFFPTVYHHHGQVRQALGNAGFAELYRQYLAIRGDATEDPLVAELRRHVN